MLDKSRKAGIIALRLAGLCKGSTADSDSVCEGSNPSPAATFKPQIQWIWGFFLCFLNFLRQNGPNRIFRHWFLSFLSSQLSLFRAEICRFISIFACNKQLFVLILSKSAAQKFAFAKPFLRLQMAEWWQKWWQKFGRQISSKPAQRKAFSDCVHSKSEKSPLQRAIRLVEYFRIILSC